MEACSTTFASSLIIWIIVTLESSIRPLINADGRIAVERENPSRWVFRFLLIAVVIFPFLISISIGQVQAGEPRESTHWRSSFQLREVQEDVRQKWEHEDPHEDTYQWVRGDKMKVNMLMSQNNHSKISKNDIFFLRDVYFELRLWFFKYIEIAASYASWTMSLEYANEFKFALISISCCSIRNDFCSHPMNGTCICPTGTALAESRVLLDPRFSHLLYALLISRTLSLASATLNSRISHSFMTLSEQSRRERRDILTRKADYRLREPKRMVE